MKPTAFVINTARGNIIEEEALVAALEAGKLAGAGLDVFEQEPKVHPALIAMKNVVLLPHIGSATAETRLRMALLATVNLLAALEGDALRTWSIRRCSLTKIPVSISGLRDAVPAGK